MRSAALGAIVCATATASVCSPVAAAPAPGRYEATLCVQTGVAHPASCGPAEFEMRSKDRAEVRVSDVVYRLHLRPKQVDIMTMQGRMEIDEFSAFYQWKGNALLFFDPDKNVVYEVRPGRRTGRR